MNYTKPNLQEEVKKVKEILATMYTVGDKIIRYYNLAPGTYTAEYVHKIIQVREGKFYVRDHECDAACSRHFGRDKNDIYDPSNNYTVTFKRDTISIDVVISNLFHTIREYEKRARLGGKKAHRWVIKDCLPTTAKSKVCLPDKKTMERVSKMICKNKPGSRYAVFSTVDGNLYGKMGKDFKMCIKGFDFDGGKFPRLAFCIDREQLKHLYDECQVELHEKDGTKVLIFKNETDGWTIGTPFQLTDEDIIRQYGEDFMPALTLPELEPNIEPETDKEESEDAGPEKISPNREVVASTSLAVHQHGHIPSEPESDLKCMSIPRHLLLPIPPLRARCLLSIKRNEFTKC